MVQSLEKALILLNAIASHGGMVGVRELSRITGIKAPTAQQLLKTLQAFHYLDFDENSRRYRIGMAAILLSKGGDPSARILEALKPVVDGLFEEFGETTAVIKYENARCSSVYGRRCEKPLGTTMLSAHDITNFHVTAAGQAVLAWAAPSEVENYIKRKTAEGGLLGIGEGDFLKRLERIRELGYAELIDFNKSSAAAYGAPIFDITGNAVFAIGWSVPLARFDEKLREALLPKLMGAASRLSELIGGAPKASVQNKGGLCA